MGAKAAAAIRVRHSMRPAEDFAELVLSVSRAQRHRVAGNASKTRLFAGRRIGLGFRGLYRGRGVAKPAIPVGRNLHRRQDGWLAVQMDMLMDYFSIVEERMDFTPAFRLERAIPRRVLKKVADHRYTVNQHLPQ
jgi:hypothetical protein